MTKQKLYPFINRHTGEVEVMTRQKGKELNEDWEQPKVVKNDKGKKVFRFHIAAPAKDRNGKIHQGIATIDISEVETEKDGNGSAE